MARPQKDGVDYWPFDVDLFGDKKFKLIKGEFGSKGILIALFIINEIYRTGGYYRAWDDDDCLLMSEGVGCGCTPALISEVVHRCCERSLFCKRVFDAFGVLTSVGIQRRWLRIVANNRDSVPIYKEYWLLDIGDKNDVPPSTLNKLAIKSITSKENPVNLKENTVNLKSNSTNQSKSYQSKLNQNKSNHLAVEPRPNTYVREAEDDDDNDKIIKKVEALILGRKASRRESQELLNLCKVYSHTDILEAIDRTHSCSGKSVAYLGKTLESAHKTGHDYGQSNTHKEPTSAGGMYKTHYDISEVEALMDEDFWEDIADANHKNNAE